MRAYATRGSAGWEEGSGQASGLLQRLATENPVVERHAALQRLAYDRATVVAQLGRDKLIEMKGGKFKRKKKERREAERVATWLSSNGHAQARHVAMTTAALDARNIPLATTFEDDSDLQKAALDVLSANEQRLNNWYSETEDPRIELWCHRDDAVNVRGRRKTRRPEWHQHVVPLPAHNGFGDAEPEDLAYIAGVFDRDAWSGSPKGLVTCSPSETQPG